MANSSFKRFLAILGLCLWLSNPVELFGQEQDTSAKDEQGTVDSSICYAGLNFKIWVDCPSTSSARSLCDGDCWDVTFNSDGTIPFGLPIAIFGEIPPEDNFGLEGDPLFKETPLATTYAAVGHDVDGDGKPDFTLTLKFTPCRSIFQSQSTPCIRVTGSLAGKENISIPPAPPNFKKFKCTLRGFQIHD